MRQLKKQWNKLILRDNCHPFKAGVVLWVQISVWIIYSTALRNMVYMLPDKDVAAAMLNLELSVGGTLWFPNLTMVDSSLILPVTFGLVNLIIIELQERSRVKKTTKFQKYVTNFFRVLSVVMVPIAAGVPSCLCLYWVTSSVTGLAHNLMMLSPRVRRLSGIPATPSERAQPYTHLRRELQEALTFKKNVRQQ
ncbi:cytochrome c oxidase assembly protein COX18, mitochondrial isoform X2 [Bacillus rossius redtenbacheri]|uniref:cytochrome c oxidase assembly protein COX18, mitochondrial isoform X2 n=1 Tax=Bacillus rossius redtenbacheri TaxID=93214 RepID=UPI002FDDDFD9